MTGPATTAADGAWASSMAMRNEPKLAAFSLPATSRAAPRGSSTVYTPLSARSAVPPGRAMTYVTFTEALLNGWSADRFTTSSAAPSARRTRMSSVPNFERSIGTSAA